MARRSRERLMSTFERSAGICILSTSLLMMQSHVFSRVVSQQKEIQPKSNAQLIHSVEGNDLYRAYCASCHGISAHGDGPAAPALKAKVPDLTLIAKRNHGVFPSSRVTRTISGAEIPEARSEKVLEE